MSLIGERLWAHWLAQGIDPPGGVSEERLFEADETSACDLSAGVPIRL